MNTLIISADDFGITQGVTEGIAQSIKSGFVSRTSAMMCTQGYEWIAEYGKGIEDKIGLHLQLTDGTPLTNPDLIPSLVTEEGVFPSTWRKLKRVNPEEVKIEWEAQIQAILNTGITPSHVDTHHNVHRFRTIFSCYCDLAKKYKLPTRPLSGNMAKQLKQMGIAGSDHCIEEWQGEDVSVNSLVSHALSAVRKLNTSNNTIELMVHPGYVDENLESRSHYLKAREAELNILCDDKLPKLLEFHGFKIA